ncbi:MAG TPA: calcium-binding protein, partial [Actinomycetota bacterium]|nr:calcium-binding protein [Actinomycetota bacterium]
MASRRRPVATAAIVLILAVSALPSASAAASCKGKRATHDFSGMVGVRFSGTPKADVIVGSSAGDELFGKGGNDTICSGGGGDFVIGGPGNDTLALGDDDDYTLADAGKDSYDGGGGLDGVDYFQTSAALVADLAKDTVVAKGVTEKIKSVEVIWGSKGNDRLLGDNGENYLFGWDGNDRILGKGGNDFTTGDLGDDVLDGGTGELNGISYADSGTPVSADLSAGTATGEGSDTFSNFNILNGSRHDDTLVGSDGGEHIIGGDGEDNMQARGGDDFVYADNGDDTIEGGDGLDTISYWFLARLVKVDLGEGSTVEGHEFFNQDFDTFTSIEAAIGSDYEDELIGSSADDILDGGDGNDILTGLGGDHDVLRGGAGDDTINGGDGDADLATFSEATAGVTADLNAGSATGQGSDSLVDIESLMGGAGNDRLTGDG